MSEDGDLVALDGTTGEADATGEAGEELALSAADLAGWSAPAAVLSWLSRHERVTVGGLWGSAQGALIAALLAENPDDDPWLVVASGEGDAEALHGDLLALGASAALFPARAGGTGDRGRGDTDALRERIEVTRALTEPGREKPRAIVASALALLQAVPTIKDLERDLVRIALEDVLDIDALVRQLVKRGYERVPMAESPGELSWRGDILDVFTFASELPLRIELFEDEVESLRSFDPETQRSVESFERVELLTTAPPDDDTDGALLIGLLPGSAVFCELEPLRTEERFERLRIRTPVHERALRHLRTTLEGRPWVGVQSLPSDDVNVDSRSVQSLEVGMTRAAETLREAMGEASRVIVLCPSAADARLFRERVERDGGAEGVETRIASLSRGCRLPELGLIVVNHRELKGHLAARRSSKKKAVGTHRVRAIQSFFELKPRDLVVHAVHGLGRFVGLERMERSGGQEEHLHIKYQGNVSLFVPASRIDLVQRYIGSGGAALPLDKIGGTAFRKRKERVQRGLFDLAGELIGLEAKRSLKKRAPWRGDDELVRGLIDSFPYTDTEDQASVDKSIEEDLYGEHPMDRLLCGDVGFGKTELAIRAAFRVVNGGGQVAVLVPTTVLAQQHFATFSERLADLPVTVRTVSRYASTHERRETLEGLEDGSVDIVIGTHRILSKDVRFQRLGLVIIDEEQRFGVTHKEHFKKMRAAVDVLSLTATPIPRTLHMSLSGLRDISALSIPPPGRQAIETRIAYSEDDDLITAAIQAERDRGGQVYFLHNRVSSIESCARRLQSLLPQGTFAVGHGQMHSSELRDVMDTFTRGDADVLVATTIIENGIDVPSAGTILIDSADMFGLSELHQLRGRVGRGNTKSTCYLLIEKHKPLRDIARERLKALEEMAHLGSGFGISVKDLELRGAGNILGAEQSGHIAAVGYDMFCRLLRATVERLQAGEAIEASERPEEAEAGVELELGLDAYLPDEWIQDADVRLEVLRELSQTHSDADIDECRRSLTDRFGRIPPPAVSLLRAFRLKAHLDPFGLSRFAWRGDRYLIEYKDRVGLERLFGPYQLDLRRIKSGVAHLVVPEEVAGSSPEAQPELALAWIEGLLKEHPESSTIGASGPPSDPG